MNVHRLSWILGLMLALTSTSMLSFAADDERDPARAEVLFEEGRKALAAEDYASACTKFRESQRLDPGTGTLMNLATCEGKKGEVASAWRHWNQAKDSLAVDDDRAEFVAEQISALKPRVPYLTLKLGSGLPEGGSVWLDGVELDRSDLDTALPADPGKHDVVVKAPGFGDKEYAVELAEADKTELLVETGKALPAEGKAATAEAEVKTTGTPLKLSRRTIGIAVGGVGAAGVLSAVITGLMVNSAESTVEANCNAQKQCNQDGLDAAEEGDSLVVVNAVSWGVGLVGLGVGAYLIFTDKKPEGPTQKVAVRGLPGGAALTYGGTF